VTGWEAEGDRRGLQRLTRDFWRDGAAWVAKERRTEHGEGSDLLRQVKDNLDDARREPMKELGIPDSQERSGQEAAKRDHAWKHQRDDAARARRRRP
jgi:hypothetical protein